MTPLKGEKCWQERAVDGICAVGGLRAQPSREDLRLFVENVASLNGARVAALLHAKMVCIKTNPLSDSCGYTDWRLDAVLAPCWLACLSSPPITDLRMYKASEGGKRLRGWASQCRKALHGRWYCALCMLWRLLCSRAAQQHAARSPCTSRWAAPALACVRCRRLDHCSHFMRRQCKSPSGSLCWRVWFRPHVGGLQSMKGVGEQLACK
jgi:hypothetical protein